MVKDRMLYKLRTDKMSTLTTAIQYSTESYSKDNKAKTKGGC